MKFSLNVALFLVTVTTVFAAGPKEYKNIKCSTCVAKFLDSKEISKVCQSDRTPDQWVKYVGCVTNGGANLSLALEHCWEDAVHKDDDQPKTQARADLYFTDGVCPTPDKGFTQENFNYHCCYQNHALEFSEMTWEDFKKLQEKCWKTSF